LSTINAESHVPVSIALKAKSIRPSSRTGCCCGLAALLLLATSDNLQHANAATDDSRTISLHHTHTNEDITVTFRRNGRYDDEGLKKLNWFLRDWRNDQTTRMDPQLFDVLWEVQRENGLDKPIHVVSAYRSAQTNSMLRRRGRGVARQSQHMVGRAMDFFIPGVPLESLRVIGLRMQRGGVGYYPTSGSPFVHLDTGSVRHWPRMTREQLARVFPDGRTVHIPTDGQPLSGYTVALADIERRGGNASAPSLDAARHAGVLSESPEAAGTDKPKRNLLAWLFKGSKEEDAAKDEDGDAAETAQPARAGTGKGRPATVMAAFHRPSAPKEQASARIANVPLPPVRPAAFQVASAAPAAAAPRAVQTTRLLPGATPTPNDIISLRGFWEGLPPMEQAAVAPRDPNAIRPPKDIPSVEPETTASIGGTMLASHNDRISPELALAYAAEPVAEQRSRTAALGAPMARIPATADTTVAVKRASGRPAAVASASTAQNVARPGERYDDPWLRAMVWAPSASDYMSTTLFTPPDFRQLQPLMHKPPSSVMMTFSADPHLGIVCERFSGSAIVFMSTVTFGMRTAALR
jgi:uncharacterized protein YcbK (DUF882 family)